jgi:AcrR family transcriptional regulator
MFPIDPPRGRSNLAVACSRTSFAIANVVPITNNVRVKYDVRVTETIPAPPWRTPRKATIPRQPLSGEAVLDAALRIVDREGLDGLSMRRVAQELGTGAASLYAYVTSKEELLEQLLDRALGEVPIPSVDPSRWAAQLTRLHFDMRDVLLAHRDLARATQATVPLGPNVLRIVEAALGLLRVGGVPDRAAGWAVDQLTQLVVADVVEAAMHRSKGRESQLRDYFGALPAERFPNLVAMADLMVEGGGDERFAFGLGLMVDGLAALAREAAG